MQGLRLLQSLHISCPILSKHSCEKMLDNSSFLCYNTQALRECINIAE